MIVMLANNTGIRTGYMVGRYPGKIGHLFSPGGQKGPFEFMEYALDNGTFSSGENWIEGGWLKLMEWAKISGHNPKWALVPDVVADKIGTLKKWDKYYDYVRSFGWPVAFAVQDGMIPTDVPKAADVIFVGGSTAWKWGTLDMWCKSFPRVHVGRVNTYRRLWDCHDAGAESVDGTGWMRGNQVQYRGLMNYLEESTGAQNRTIQHEIFGGEHAVCISRVFD